MKNTVLEGIKVITKKDYEKALEEANKECENIPRSHTRVYAVEHSEALQRAIAKIPNRKDGEVAEYVYTYSSTQGRGQYRWSYREVGKDTLTKDTRISDKLIGTTRRIYVMALIKK
jgi:hypothetical protein